MLRALPFRWLPDTITQDQVLGMIGLKLDMIAYDRRLIFDQLKASGLIEVSSWPDLEEIRFPILEQSGGMQLCYNDKLMRVEIPLLTGFILDPNVENVAIAYNPMLTTIEMPQLATWGWSWIDFSNNALSEATVNGVLARMVADSAFHGDAYLNGGTNAAPSGQGLTDKATLIARGGNIQTN